MPVTTRFQMVDRAGIVNTAGMMSQQAAKAVADAHRTAVAEATAINARALGQAPVSTTFVNGAVSRDLEAVKPGRTIVTSFDLGSEALEYIEAMLIANAPHLTGRFQRSITVYADGVEVTDVREALTAQEIVFTSTAPYARKIERGQSSQAPDGVFEAVAAMAARRFGNTAKIRFSYREPVGGASALEKWAGARRGRSRRQSARDRRQPAIVVSLR